MAPRVKMSVSRFWDHTIFGESLLQGGPPTGCNSIYRGYNLSYPFIRPFIGTITQFITNRGPPCTDMSICLGCNHEIEPRRNGSGIGFVGSDGSMPCLRRIPTGSSVQPNLWELFFHNFGRRFSSCSRTDFHVIASITLEIRFADFSSLSSRCCHFSVR